MYSKFKYESIALKDISLDVKNPRIVTQKPITNQSKIIEYLFEHEDLAGFIKKIAGEGKNHGAERPYVIKSGSGYTVVEGNTRIAAYKLLTGLIPTPKNHTSAVPLISEDARKSMLVVDCSVAPNRDALLSVMASAHFGDGDKSKWGYLGSRKAVYDEWTSGKSIPALAKAFGVNQGDIKGFILEYKLYLEGLKLHWSAAEKEVLLDPNVKFNPPVRFLQAHGHADMVGIQYDRTNLEVRFTDNEAKRKFKHLLNKLVINTSRGLGATARYADVFADYASNSNTPKPEDDDKKGDKGDGGSGGGNPDDDKGGDKGTAKKGKPNALFNYDCTITDALLDQLMKEARAINCKNFPASATFLLRNIVEALLKHIIHEQKANKDGKSLTLAPCIDLCLGDKVQLPKADKAILKAFKADHLEYLNLGAHGNTVPNKDRLFQARDGIDQFVKRYV